MTLASKEVIHKTTLVYYFFTCFTCCNLKFQSLTSHALDYFITSNFHTYEILMASILFSSISGFSFLLLCNFAYFSYIYFKLKIYVGVPQLSFLSSTLFFIYTLSVGAIIQPLDWNTIKYWFSSFMLILLGQSIHWAPYLYIQLSIWWMNKSYHVQNVLTYKICFSYNGPYLSWCRHHLLKASKPETEEYSFSLTIFH